MQILNSNQGRRSLPGPWSKGRSSPAIRGGLLFANFFLIILAFYHLKPASRSLFIESLGADELPQVWIGVAFAMVVVIAFYNRLVERVDRLRVVLGSLLLFAGLLVVFRVLLAKPTEEVTVCLYIFVDVLGVVLVEQFWSLTNSIYNTREGKRWYGFVGTGGLVGGVAGGGEAAMLIRWTPMQTPDLLLAGAAILMLIFVLTWVMARLGLYQETHPSVKTETAAGDWRALRHNRYLLLIAAVLLLAQAASPLVEFQFLKSVEGVYSDLDARTAFLSMFFSLMGIISIGVNLGLTPVIHRRLGVIAGLLVQPMMMSLCSGGFWAYPTLFTAAATKISDRGLSYSINRASKELLYVPLDPVLIYQAKAWIDMFGYRIFKVFGSLLILLFTHWLPVKWGFTQLSWVTLGLCGIWMWIILILRRYYLRISEKPLEEPKLP